MAWLPLIVAILLTYIPSLAHAHGRLLDPPSRMSAWRFNYDVPINYDDNGFNCGGFANQWYKNKGKCGICGDAWNGPRPYERPDGRMVKKLVITREYKEGETIVVDVEVTKNHLGWFEFRLCDVRESGGKEATQDCLNRHVLADRRGETRFDIGAKEGNIRFRLVLPPHLTCPLCVFQWKWHCANNVGYGEKQEEFYACSDIKINPTNGGPFPDVTLPPPTRRPPTPPPAVTPTNKTPTRQPPPPPSPTPTLPLPPLEVITNPPIEILPPDVLYILRDASKPLSDRIRYYVNYQQSRKANYAVWTYNTIDYRPRQRYQSNGYFVSNPSSQEGGGGGAGGKDNNKKETSANSSSSYSNNLFCQACKMDCGLVKCTQMCPKECPTNPGHYAMKQHYG